MRKASVRTCSRTANLPRPNHTVLDAYPWPLGNGVATAFSIALAKVNDSVKKRQANKCQVMKQAPAVEGEYDPFCLQSPKYHHLTFSWNTILQNNPLHLQP